MSYTRYPDANNEITFYYAKSNIFNLVNVRTMYRAKTIKDKDGESLIDDYAMSNDEMDSFEIFLEDAINDALQIVLKMTSGVDEALILDGDVTTAAIGTKVENCYGFKIADEESFNENNLYTVDDGVKKYLQYHVLAAWYNLTGLTEEEAKWEMKKAIARQDLISNRLFQLRKKSIS